MDFYKTEFYRMLGYDYRGLVGLERYDFYIAQKYYYDMREHARRPHQLFGSYYTYALYMMNLGAPDDLVLQYILLGKLDDRLLTFPEDRSLCGLKCMCDALSIRYPYMNFRNYLYEYHMEVLSLGDNNYLEWVERMCRR